MSQRTYTNYCISKVGWVTAAATAINSYFVSHDLKMRNELWYRRAFIASPSLISFALCTCVVVNDNRETVSAFILV